MVKKAIVFLVSFVVLYFAAQLASGMLLTLFYTPDLTNAWQQSANLPSQVSFGKVTFPLNWTALLISLILSFFISMIWRRRKTRD